MVLCFTVFEVPAAPTVRTSGGQACPVYHVGVLTAPTSCDSCYVFCCIRSFAAGMQLQQNEGPAKHAGLAVFADVRLMPWISITRK